MRTNYELQIRAFPVKVRDGRTGEEKTDIIVFDKARLQAANLVGQSSKELIERAYQKEGFTVLDIGKADKVNVDIRLDNIYEELTGRAQIPMDQLWSAGGDRR